MLDDRLAIMAVAPPAGRIAEIGVVPGPVDDHIIGKAQGHAAGLGAQGDQLTLGIEGQQALDGVGDDQPAIRMPGQAQGAAAGVGQHLEDLAVQAAADHPAVMQAADQETVFQQQGFGPREVDRADVLHVPEPLVFGKHPRDQGRCWRRLPGHGLHLGRRQQQEQPDQHHDHQQQTTEADAPVRAAHQATAPAGLPSVPSARSRRASSDTADSRSIRRLSSN
ncbi:hypothetical protein D3C81_1420890 [compost metagenome]